MAATLGEALSSQQLGIMAGSALGFLALSSWGENLPWAKKLKDGTWAPLSHRERKLVAVSMCGATHAVVASIAGLRILTQRDPAIYNNVYGKSHLSQTLFAFSSGYFMWDLAMCLANTDVYGRDFVFHASACLTCYVLGQRPFLNYYGAMFLLFELSTPFLHARSYLLTTGQKSHPWFDTIQNCFGYSFLAVRILYGYPLSVHFINDMLALLDSGQYHSKAVVYFNMAADIGLCLLNGIWLSQMLKKRLGRRGSRHGNSESQSSTEKSE